MSWFFAILIVLAMGGVAAVAVGHGRQLADVHDDRPDAEVQADGPLTAGDLRRVRFSLVVRGYRMSEVDSLLDRLAGELEHGHSHCAGGPEGDPDGDGDTGSKAGPRGRD